jgi:hypothetical protein
MDIAHLQQIGLEVARVTEEHVTNEEVGGGHHVEDGYYQQMPTNDSPPLSCSQECVAIDSKMSCSKVYVRGMQFSSLDSEDQATEKRAVLAALHKKSSWHRTIAALIPRHNIRISCTSNAKSNLIAAHLSLHNDFKLIKLGRDHGFPRGFCIIVNIEKELLVGQGTFYPKFANDDRNSSFSSKDFGGIEKISCFIKYSGSTGIISIIRNERGDVIGWTGSSKNSCNHSIGPTSDISYAAETVEVFSKYATDVFLQWCQRHEVYSLGLEVFISHDQSHGYGYASSGCIVTAICAGVCSDGRPTYLLPEDMYDACCEIGLPTDKPICVEGKNSIQNFIEALSEVRDILTLGMLRNVLEQRCGVVLETLHDRLIDSEIVEGFVIRRWRGSAEVDAIKFKIWLYQMVTQVLRPSFSSKRFPDFRCEMISLRASNGTLRQTFHDLVRTEMKRWCLLPNAATKKLCHWVVCKAAEACLPDGHFQLLWSRRDGSEFPVQADTPQDCMPRDPNRAYWITLGDHAVKRLIEVMDAVGWDVARAALSLKS